MLIMKRFDFFSKLSVSITIILSSFILSGCSKTAPAPAPIASFTWAAQSLTAPATVTFTNTSTNGTSYSWEFGDGGSSSLQSPTYTYNKSGSYTARLTVTGAGGSNTTSQTITIATPTSLEITVKGYLGNNAPGATVKLYPTQADWVNETNQVLTTQTTDANGVVTFSPLTPTKYFWKVSVGCQNNIFGVITTTSNLTANVKNTVNTVLSQTGTLEFKNNSSNPYEIFINGISTISSLSGGATSRVIVPAGPYSIRVLQKSGFVLFPTEQNYNATVACGSNILVSFP
jgi:PKD repeat protein